MATDIAPSALDDGAHSPASPFRSLLGRMRAFWAPRRRQALALILLLAAFTNFYELQRNGYANLYYAAAIRSMLESWHNFFFVSFDPAGFVSVDKPPLGFWIQTASAKLLGYSGFSILLPEALAGVASVGVLYLVVRRVFGAGAGLLAALFLAITPISVVTNRNNTIDSLLVLTVLLGAYAMTRAVERGSLRWLLLAAVLVGLGFNIKMLEAYLVVPAFLVMYLLGAPLRWRTRLWHLATSGVVMGALSLAWVVAVDLTPASARPYVGSSGTNSELDLALGYNGIQRLLGMVFGRGGGASSGASIISAITNGSNAVGGPGGASENGVPGLFRLLNAQLGGQVSWLLALAVGGLFATGWGIHWNGQSLVAHVRSWFRSAEARRNAHLTPQQSALALWGGWTLTMAVFFSVAGFFHTYYLSMLAPGIAALAAIGLTLLWRDYRAAGWHGYLLPVALVVTAFVQGVILADYTGWNAWMTPLIVGGSLLIAALLAWWRYTRLAIQVSAPTAPAVLEERGEIVDAPVYTPRNALVDRLTRSSAVAAVAVALGVALLLLGPATWVGVSLASGAGGTLPTAGPSPSANLAQGGGFGGNGGPRGQGGRLPNGFVPGGPRSGGLGGFPPAFGEPGNGQFGPGNGGGSNDAPTGGPANGNSGQSLRVNQQLLAYLEAHRGSARYLLATLSSQTAAPYIIASGQPVIALGGFTGSDQILTVSQLQALVSSGAIRYFLLDGGGGFGGQGGGNGQLVSWVASNCAQVAASEYGGASSGTLYACSSAG
ncbi:MAG TPA: glycosyltransferase family 39 protein [Ktedonobacterales bacterium]|jgi:4-amino-4-deoxy-L-arabinose transferase-like glycosyltransferase